MNNLFENLSYQKYLVLAFDAIDIGIYHTDSVTIAWTFIIPDKTYDRLYLSDDSLPSTGPQKPRIGQM